MPVASTRMLAAVGATAAAITATAVPAHADEATPRDFWRAAASATTTTMYAPTDRALGKVGLGSLNPFDGSLRMLCADDWFVTTGFDATEGGGSLTLIQASSPDCIPDPPGADTSVVPSPTKLTVAGRRVTTLFLGCFDAGDSASVGLAESACPVSERNYFSYGTLPSADGRASTYLNVQAQGLSRGQVGAVLRSLRPVL